MRLRVGDRVQVRLRDDLPWEKGTVKKLDNGIPKMQTDEGPHSGDIWWYRHVQPLVITQFFYTELS